MFESVFESFGKATETTMRSQQEMFQKMWKAWAENTPQFAAPRGESMQKYQKKCQEFFNEMLQKQRGTLETQYKAGLASMEEAFKLSEAKDFEELRAKTVELWQKSCDALKKSYEAQVQDFQAAVTKWTEIFTKSEA